MLKDLVAELHHLICHRKTLEAMEKFYADTVCMQENCSPMRCGKKLNIENEIFNLKKVRHFEATPVSLSINENTGIVFSEWKISITDLNDQTHVIEEVSVQHWKNEQIIFERFYYNAI